MTDEFAIKILEQYREKPTLINEIETVEEAVWLDEALATGIKALEQEPKIGHWIPIDEEPHEDYECDNCGYICSAFPTNIDPNEEYKYCPNCGARMIEPQESEDKE